MTTYLGDMRDALRDTIVNTITTLRGYDTVPEVTQLPAVVIEPVAAEKNSFQQANFGVWQFDVMILVARQDSAHSQNKLDAYLDGATSVVKVLHDNPTLGKSDLDAYVTGMSGYGGHHDSNKIPHIGAVLRVQVMRT